MYRKNTFTESINVREDSAVKIKVIYNTYNI